MSKIYQKLVRPLLFRLPTETAHEFGIDSLKFALKSKVAQEIFADKFACNNFGELKRFGLTFKNPLGIAAGFDKNGIVISQLNALGFGFVEVGTVTYNQGTPRVVERLKKLRPNCLLGINIGKNKDVPNDKAIENYIKSFDLAFEVADYIAVNVSSPNTPSLRELQKADALEELLSALQKRNYELNKRSKKNLPLLIKIALDLSESEVESIVDICLRLKIAGVIAANTTISRENLQSSKMEIEKIGSGGLSGKPVKNLSNEVIKQIYRFSKGKLPVVGVGGIFTAQDAFEKIAAGACLIQAYTGFIYQGFTFARDVNFGLVKILREKGFENLDEAIGVKASPKTKV
ncbi:MAG: dihydroorotate dehydrogenase (quinone) [Acidobacteria bacterium]|nr:dihydroorotate dehydrogenase (quinone) [Acidobacteriota bacterium]